MFRSFFWSTSSNILNKRFVKEWTEDDYKDLFITVFLYYFQILFWLCCTSVLFFCAAFSPVPFMLEIFYISLLLSSLLEVPLRPTITSLNLHCNRIPRIEGLASAWLLRHLDLSSNCIAKIEGLASLTTLRTLNLSCNAITKVEGEPIPLHCTPERRFLIFLRYEPTFRQFFFPLLWLVRANLRYFYNKQQFGKYCSEQRVFTLLMALPVEIYCHTKQSHSFA